MRVLVCGGRAYPDREAVRRVLDAALRSGPVVIIEGGGGRRNEPVRGADALAWEWARDRGLPCETFPADWDRYGDPAGPIRNRQMLDEGRPDMVLAFPGHSGTADMVRQAQRRGVLVVRYPPTGDHRMPFDLD